jgi:hypothetical protein
LTKNSLQLKRWSEGDLSAEKSPVIVFWDNAEKTVLVYDFAAAWTWTDYFNAKAKGDNMMDNINHDVAVVFNAPPDVRLPENFLANVVKINRSRHRRAAVSIVVIPNAFVRVMFNTVTRLYSGEFKKFAFVNTLEEARIVALDSKQKQHD